MRLANHEGGDFLFVPARRADRDRGARDRTDRGRGLKFRCARARTRLLELGQRQRPGGRLRGISRSVPERRLCRARAYSNRAVQRRASARAGRSGPGGIPTTPSSPFGLGGGKPKRRRVYGLYRPISGRRLHHARAPQASGTRNGGRAGSAERTERSLGWGLDGVWRAPGCSQVRFELRIDGGSVSGVSYTYGEGMTELKWPDPRQKNVAELAPDGTLEIRTQTHHVEGTARRRHRKGRGRQVPGSRLAHKCNRDFQLSRK